MDFKFLVLVLVIFGLVNINSCQDAKRDELDKAIFTETDPPLDRDQVIEMLKDLRKLHDDKDWQSEIIDEVLERSVISEKNCDRTAREFFLAYNGYTGRAEKLLLDSQDLQAKFCLNSWNTSLLSLIANLDGSVRDSVNSIIDSMIIANDGDSFDEMWMDMPYKNAQEGVLRYMEKRSKLTFSRRTGQATFDKVFNESILEPCTRVINKLSRDAERYIYIFRSTDLANQLDSSALEWAKNELICKQLLGHGFSGKAQNTFSQDTFQNLAFRKNKSYFNW